MCAKRYYHCTSLAQQSESALKGTSSLDNIALDVPRATNQIVSLIIHENERIGMNGPTGDGERNEA